MADPHASVSVPSLFACLYQPPVAEAERNASDEPGSLAAIARDFSPRFEIDRDDLVSIDVSGLTRLLGPAQTIGEELRRAAAGRGIRAHVAIAATRAAAMVLAQARPGLTVVAAGEEAAALAPLSIMVLGKVLAPMPVAASAQNIFDAQNSASSAISAVKHWGIRTLGDLAALPAADLASRLGRAALVWQAVARGEDVRPLIPTLDAERFDFSLELEWPIEGLEPLSFVLTRVLEPLSTRLERRDRGAAVLHVVLRLVTHEIYARRLELPTPMRDVRTLRTLALLDLESHPPSAAIDRVTVVIDPTPGRVLQHTLYTRAHPTPEQLSTLIARLGAVMGQDRVSAPATVDSYRPGAFAMRPFATDHDNNRGDREARREKNVSAISARSAVNPLISARRRCRQPVPARVAVQDDRPVRVTTDRRGFAGGAVIRAAGPWRVSGEWWESACRHTGAFNRDEWDIALADGAVYVVFRDRDTERWFIDAIVD
jgi:protein ImuB